MLPFLCATMGCNYVSLILILNAYLRISWRKTRKFFPAEPFFCMSCMKCLSNALFQEILPRKIPGGAPVTFNLTFHPNFYPNNLVFANLPIYRKLIHDNI